MTPPEEIQRSNNAGAGAPGLRACDSDETDNPKKTIERCKEKYRLLSIRSAILQQENEELTNKLTTLRETIRKARKIRRQLLQRLDADNDEWRSGSIRKTTAMAPTSAQPNSIPHSAKSLTAPNIPLPVLSFTSTPASRT